jgi:hypothetical protein
MLTMLQRTDISLTVDLLSYVCSGRASSASEAFGVSHEASSEVLELFNRNHDRPQRADQRES